MRRVLSSVTAVALAAGALVTTAGGAEARGRTYRPSSVIVTGDGSRVTVSQRTVNEGYVSFQVSATNSKVSSSISMFQPKAHVTVARLMSDLQEEFNQDPRVAAKGTRDLTRDGRFFGLADVSKGTPATVTEFLQEGTYYLMDLGAPPAGPPALTTLRVRESEVWRHQTPPHFRAIVSLTSADRFIAPRTLPARGTILVRNVSDTLHFMEIQPVKKGTTDKQIQAYFDSGADGPPAFALDGPNIGLDVLSPGRPARLTYQLPPGTYVLLCFIADDRTGMPHAFMGMHKVVTLK